MAAGIMLEKRSSPQSATSPAPRKRRRRTTTTGAADDCFACQDTSTACDRRRPYCTQCLERGRTCSGYKTTLTWGIGVASRGKLRGLTLPVAKQQKTTPQTIKKEAITKAKTERRMSSNTSAQPTTFDFVSVEPSSHRETPRSTPTQQQSEFHWPSQTPSQTTSSVREEAVPIKKHTRQLSLQPLSVPPPMASYALSPVPMTASTISYSPYDSYGASPLTPGYDSPTEVTPIQRHFPNPSAWTGAFATQYYTEPSMVYAANSLITSNPGTYSKPAIDLDGFDARASIIEPDEVEGITRGDADLSLRALYGLPDVQVGSTQALRELITYFDHVISPVIVAFESPSNPYRSHILPLASSSPALQHAIAALSASNLRIRKDQQSASNAQRLALTNSDLDNLHDASVRKSSIAHSILQESLLENDYTAPGVPSQREIYHKGESIKALNANLRDSSKRDEDSVLATLLILCLYHICDTGVAKFKTQFAGVKRILGLRSKRATTSESRWMITMFRWFDAMAATVNDRENQFDEDDIDDGLFHGDEWALENLAGCDSRLFAIISRLGRLNLLSQGKAVKGMTQSRALPVRNDKIDETSYRNFDGNGWSRLDPSESAANDIRSQFWAEFSSIRQELGDWRFDVTTIPLKMNIDSQQMASNSADLQNISEAFRFAALLYTERLGHPHASSSMPAFQDLVSSAIHYIDAVKSDVYLLWPMFITGTECVLKEHRDLIRRRCMSIQGDSGFYNNTSTLRLLEQVWKDNDEAAANAIDEHHDVYSLPGTYSAGDALKWRKAMRHTAADGEYIVV